MNRLIERTVVFAKSACQLAVFLIPLSGHALTLKQAAMHTLNNHPQVLAAKAGQLASHFALNEAIGGYYPHLSVNVGRGQEISDNIFTRANGRSSVSLFRQENGFNLDQMVFDGWRVRSQVRQEESNLQMSNYKLVESEQNMILLTAEAFFNVIRGRELVLLAISNIKVHQDTLEQVNMRFKAGAGTTGEIELAKSRLELAQIRLTNARGFLKQANARFYSLVGMLPPRQLAKPASIRSYLPKSLTDSVHIALNNNPTIASNKAELTARGEAVNVARSTLYPNVNVEIHGTHNQNIDGIMGRNRDLAAMLVLNYNVFNGGSDIAALNKARSQEIESRHNLQSLRRDVIESVTSTWAEMVTKRSQYTKQRRYVVYSKNVVQDYKEQFTLGKRALFNVLDAENELFRARTGLTNAYYDAIISDYRLLANIGRLTPKVLS